MVARMRAIVIEAPGGPEVLKWQEVPTPEPGRGEVRVRVRATAVNRADLLQRMGLYPAPPDAPQQIPGLEFAGEIDAVGAGVSAWKLGDRVFGLVGGGAYAEELTTHADCVARMPDALAFAAGDATLSWRGYADRSDALAAALVGAGLAPGERVAVLLPDGPGVHVAFVATEKAGLVAVGIGPRAGEAEIRHLVERSGAVALVSRARHRELDTRALYASRRCWISANLL